MMMTEKEYIEREPIIQFIEHGLNEKKFGYDAIEILGEIQFTPAADVAPVKHGEWKGYTHSKFYGLDKDDNPIYRDGVLYYCSECRRRSIIKTSYCPNCGADMRGDNT